MQLCHRWLHLARPEQIDPSLIGKDWAIWLLLGGRGSGKTRAGAEWIREQVARNRVGRVALLGPTLQDAREVMLEGESGLLNIGYPSERPNYISSRRRLEWPNGAVGHIFSAEDPESLRGPQFGAAWADEFCAWSYPAETLANLRFGLRQGETPRLVISTTPKPTIALKRLLKTPELVISRSATRENAANLSPAFLRAVEEAYGGTRLGRQELEGEVIENIQGALWTRNLLDKCRSSDLPDLSRIVVAIDPPVTSGKTADACGLVVAGKAALTGHVFILQDATVRGLSPMGWAERAVGLYHSWQADRIVAEVNQGGEMVTEILRQIDANIPIHSVFATRGKRTRAEPIAAAYERGVVFHHGRLDALEDELTMIGTRALKHSPDRADALVWAVTALLDMRADSPRIRRI